MESLFNFDQESSEALYEFIHPEKFGKEREIWKKDELYIQMKMKGSNMIFNIYQEIDLDFPLDVPLDRNEGHINFLLDDMDWEIRMPPLSIEWMKKIDNR